MDSQIVDPSMYPKGHPVRDSYDAQVLSEIMVQDAARSHAGQQIKPMQGENEKSFNLHHDFLEPGEFDSLTPEFKQSVNKLLGITNIKEESLFELEYKFDILKYKEINYSKRKDFTPAKSRAMADFEMYFFAQIRRSVDGWEREMEKEERKVLKTEFPIAKKKNTSLMGRFFG